MTTGQELKNTTAAVDGVDLGLSKLKRDVGGQDWTLKHCGLYTKGAKTLAKNCMRKLSTSSVFISFY